MKFSLLTLTILLNIYFLVCAKESSKTSKDAIDNPNPRDCPNNQSSFSVDDLHVIINDVSAVKFNILPNITAAYYDRAIRARDEMLQEFNEFKKKTEEYPNHLVDVLDNMGDTREKKIVPLVKTAAAALQEYPGVKADFNVLYDKATTMLNNLAKYKKICELNNCNQPRAQLRMASDSLGSAYSEHICSTVEVVQETVKDRLLSFELNLLGRIGNYLLYHNGILSEKLSSLKKSLRKAVHNQFGITMYDILDLDTDYFHFMKSLLHFNSKSYTSALKKNSVTIQYQLLDLNVKIEKYRHYCLECGKVQRRMSLGVANRTILDPLIDAKISEIRYIVNNNISDIYRELNDTIHDQNYIEKILHSLEPLKDDVKKRLEVEEQALKTLVDSAPQWRRQHAHDTYQKSKDLLHDINKALDFLKPY